MGSGEEIEVQEVGLSFRVCFGPSEPQPEISHSKRGNLLRLERHDILDIGDRIFSTLQDLS